MNGRAVFPALPAQSARPSLGTGVLDPCHPYPFPYHIPSKPSLTGHRGSRRGMRLHPLFFDFFFLFKFSSQIPTFFDFFSISGRPGVDFSPFFLPKRVHGGYFFGVFSKTVILSKSCSRCGGSIIVKGGTLPKSIKNEPGTEKVRPETATEAIFVGFSCRCRSEPLSGSIFRGSDP